MVMRIAGVGQVRSSGRLPLLVTMRIAGIGGGRSSGSLLLLKVKEAEGAILLRQLVRRVIEKESGSILIGNCGLQISD